MRNQEKTLCPAILIEFGETWLSDAAQNPTSEVMKTRYRHKDIKLALFDEVFGKCIYCESKIGHNTPGDIEHIKPTSKFPKLRFEWVNLSLACTECNRRKSNYDDPDLPFLNPYTDDVEVRILHYGPIVSWVNGDSSAELTVRKLELHNGNRISLILRKIERIAEVESRMQRYQSEASDAMRELVLIELLAMAEPQSEFSAMVRQILRTNAII